MTAQPPIHDLLAAAIRGAAAVAQTRVGRNVEVAAAEPVDSSALLRFDLQFEGDAKLTWYVSNEDATGFSDLLIGGAGDRGAVLTEMHLDALSGVFSDMLDRGVEGLNAGLTQPLTAGGVDMGMEGALPAPVDGDQQAAFSLVVEGFGPLTIVEYVNAPMVALLEQRLDPAAAPAAAAAAAQAPAADSSDTAASAPMDDIDNVVPLPNLGANQEEPRRDLGMLLNVPLPVTVELGRTERTIRELLGMSVGSILELSKLAGDPMEIMVNGRVLARGEVVVIDEEFGIRVTEIVSPEERLQNLG